jgi:drug/metabolite transporter (DMT)-like permease
MVWKILLLIFGVFTAATAVIMIKHSTVDPVLLASYRLLVAGVLLLPLFMMDLRRHRRRFQWRQLRLAILPGVLLGLHFITWIIGARLTTAANSSLIVNMVPVVMPFLLVLLVRERLTRGELAGTGIAMLGLGLLAGSDLNLSREFFLGDVMCFVSMLFYALYMALARRNRTLPSLWLYVVPLYLIGGASCLGVAIARGSALPGIGSGKNLALIIGLAVVPTIMGHSIFNYSMKHLRGQVVSLLGLGQFIFAAALGVVLLSPPEIPHWSFYPAAVLVVAGAAIALRSYPSPPPTPADVP